MQLKISRSHVIVVYESQVYLCHNLLVLTHLVLSCILSSMQVLTVIVALQIAISI